MCIIGMRRAIHIPVPAREMEADALGRACRTDAGIEVERNAPMANLFLSFPSDETENGQDTRPINTELEEAQARDALRSAGLTEAAVYTGDENDPDASCNGRVFFA